MKLLLDTHVWVWSITEPERLDSIVREHIESGQDELWLSPISLWETVMMIERGALQGEQDPRGWIEHARGEYEVREASLNNAIAVESRFLDLKHRDPADRFLAATAQVYGLKMLTHDRKLLDSPGVATIGPASRE